MKPQRVQRTLLALSSLVLFSFTGMTETDQANVEIEAIISEAFILLEHIISEEERFRGEIREINKNKIKDWTKTSRLASEKSKERGRLLKELNKQLGELSTKISIQGITTLIHIESSISPPIPKDRLSYRKYLFLLSTISRIPGVEAEDALLSQHFNHRSFLPLYLLIRRTNQDMPLTLELTDAQLNYFVELITEEGTNDVRSELHFLSVLNNNHPHIRTSIVVGRYVRDIKNPDHITTLTAGMDYNTGGYLRNFSLLGPTAIPNLTIELQKPMKDPYLHNWLLIALGFSRETKVGEDLQKIILNKTVHPFQRGYAVTAYAKSQQKEAIPFLETLIDNKTEALRDAGPHAPDKVYPIQSAAQGALSQLEKGVY